MRISDLSSDVCSSDLEHGALSLQAIHHIFVMNDFVAHIDRGTIFFDGALHNMDRPVYPSAKSAWRCDQYPQERTAHVTIGHGCSLEAIVPANERRLLSVA